MAETKGKASTRAKNKYNAENYERISLVVTRGKKTKIKDFAAKKGESINGFINRVIDQEMGETEDKSK